MSDFHKIGQQIFIPKGNAGKGCFGTINYIKDPNSGWGGELYFCEEYNEGLLYEECVKIEDIITKDNLREFLWNLHLLHNH